MSMIKAINDAIITRNDRTIITYRLHGDTNTKNNS